jgi:hypothetical protein
MNLARSGIYEKTDQTRLGEGTAVAWISREAEDSCWDKFLQETPLGQFQQSTIWARAKALEGWRTVRVVVTLDEEIVGGFQILWRPSWRGRMAYVSKGPVASPENPGLAEYATELLRKLVRSERFRALVVQAPDLCKQISSRLALGGFEVDTLARVNDATWIIPLGDGFEMVEQRMSRWTRKKIRQAVNRGVRIREGGREDVRTFFDLMLSTCRRQGAAPNPADERPILALWDAAQPARCIRLTFAECDGKTLAGLVCILFGQTVSFWKKGWTSSDGQLHPNEALMHEMLKWASSRGYRFGDFCALDREMAVAMLRGDPLSPEQETSRHIFNVRLGGCPRLLPRARVYFPNSVIRLAYRAIFYKQIRLANENSSLR